MATDIEDIDSIVPKGEKQEEGKLVKTEIISASRRTDIPAFYMDGVVKAMQAGHILVTNQYNHTSDISLDPKDAKCFVWWSKDYCAWLKQYKAHKELFDKYKHMFNFTITGSDELEPGVKSSLKKRLAQVKELSELFGANAIKYRFDPIVAYLNSETGDTEYNTDHFEEIISYVSECGVKEVIIAFCVPYKKVCSRMKKNGKILVDVDDKTKSAILDKMIKTTNKYKMTLASCCNEGLVGYKNKIEPSHCVDGDIIEELLGKKLKKNSKDKGQREECNCAVSRDIGSYSMKCGHKCLYCYATPS